MDSTIVEVNESNWEAEVVSADEPVLLDFWAPWCGPCLALAPTLEAVAKLYSGRVKVVKANLDETQVLGEKFGVRGIPHLVLLRKGAPVTVVSARTRTRLAAALDEHLA